MNLVQSMMLKHDGASRQDVIRAALSAASFQKKTKKQRKTKKGLVVVLCASR